jgi:leader peptidase (prepilin peptidase)/N-methyltransferase
MKWGLSLASKVLALAFCLGGTIIGLLLPAISQKIICRKSFQKGIKPGMDTGYLKPYTKLGVCLLNALLWSFTVLRLENIKTAILLSSLFTFAILVTIIDIKIRIIPNELVLLMATAGVAFQALHFGFSSLVVAVASMIGMVGSFTAVAGLVGLCKVGAGDVKLAGAMGLVLGFPNIITALAVMSAAILIYSSVGFITKKLSLQSMVPFAPFMMFGTVFSLIRILVMS